MTIEALARVLAPTAAEIAASIDKTDEAIIVLTALGVVVSIELPLPRSPASTTSSRSTSLMSAKPFPFGSFAGTASATFNVSGMTMHRTFGSE